MLGLKLTHASKKGLWCETSIIQIQRERVIDTPKAYVALSYTAVYHIEC